MKKQRLLTKIISLSLIFLLFAIGSCKKKNNDPDYCASAWAQTVSDKATAMYNAAMAYSTDQTTAKCNAYKAAISDYIDAVEPMVNCSNLTPAQRTDWQNAVDDARDNLDSACN